VLGRAAPGQDLDVLEESWMRAGGGKKTVPGSVLTNSRVEMNDTRYRSGRRRRMLKKCKRGDVLVVPVADEKIAVAQIVEELRGNVLLAVFPMLLGCR
jgi:hypothetical protein